MTALVNPYMSFPAAGASLAFVGTARGEATTSSTISVTLPAGTQVGDRCIVVAITGSGGTSTPSGFTDLSGVNPYVGGYSTAEIRASERTLASTADLTLPGDAYSNGIEYVVFTLSTVASLDTAATTSGAPFTSPDTVCEIPSVSASGAGIALGVTGGRTPGTSWGSAPAGWTADQTRIGGYVSLWAGHKTVSGSGATGSANVTNVGANPAKEYVSVTIVVR